jgi:hypothetical protein
MKAEEIVAALPGIDVQTMDRPKTESVVDDRVTGLMDGEAPAKDRKGRAAD